MQNIGTYILNNLPAFIVTRMYNGKISLATFLQNNNKKGTLYLKENNNATVYFYLGDSIIGKGQIKNKKYCHKINITSGIRKIKSKNTKNIKFNLKVILGRTTIPVEKVKNLSSGSVLKFESNHYNPVYLYLDNHALVSGTVVVADDKFALRIDEILPKVRKEFNIENSINDQVQVSGELILGECVLSMKELSKLKRDDVIVLNSFAGEPSVFLIDQNLPIPVDITVIDENFGIRIR